MKIDKVIIAGAAIVVVLAILLFIAGACGACVFLAKMPSTHGSFGQTVHETRTDTHAGAANIELTVSTIGGKIDIQEWAQDSVQVTYDVYAPEGRLSDVETSTKDTKGVNSTRITAEVDFDEDKLFNLGNRGAHVTVMVPKGSSYSLSLHTLGGDIKVPPLHGSAAYLYTLGGKLELSGKYDAINMNTAGGDIYASYESANATFNTLGGSIVVDTTQTTGTLEANTAGGNIDVTLPSGTLFTVDASTMGGRIRHSNIHMTTSSESDWSLKGHTEDGAGSLVLELHTMGGNIDIRY